VTGLATGVSPRFHALLLAEGLGDKRVLDVGTGAGRLAFLLAPAARHVVGLDRDPARISEARRRAAAEGIANVEFHEADVEAEEYARWAPDLVTGHLCASDAIVLRAGRVLRPGACLGLVALHADQWRETGRPSRFAFDEDRMAAALGRAGLVPAVMEVERRVQRFASAAATLAAAGGQRSRWEADGRWQGFVDFVGAGGRTLTRSHLVVTARRR